MEKRALRSFAEAVKNVSPSNYFNVAFELCKTLSETSPLTRGICVMDDEKQS